MIRAQAVSYHVGGRTLVRSIGLELVPGRFVAIVGPNGAGKSTLLRLLTGELKPTSGQITLDGHDLNSFSAAYLANRRAVVAQHNALAFPFTALEVVQLGITVAGLNVTSNEAHQLAHEMLDRLGLRQIAGQPYTTLSGGERQRVQMARALCQLACGRAREPETAILVDEPTSNLDIAHQLLVLDELSRGKRAGRAVLAILHDLNLAANYTDELLLMSRGTVLAPGPAPEVMQDARLSAAFGREVRTNSVPANGAPFLLPQACSTVKAMQAVS